MHFVQVVDIAERFEALPQDESDRHGSSYVAYTGLPVSLVCSTASRQLLAACIADGAHLAFDGALA
jgi:hypothetical protein